MTVTRTITVAAGAALASRGLFRAGTGVVPAARVPGSVGEADGGAGRARPGRAVGPGAAGPAPAHRRRSGEGAVRGAGRAGGLAAHPRGDVRPVPDGGLRRLPLGQ